MIDKLLVFYGVLIVLSIVIGDVSGLGGNISGRGEGIEASKGFLIGANEVGLMLLLLSSFLFSSANSAYKAPLFLKLVVSICFTYSAVAVFTKSSLATLIVILQKWYSQSKNFSKVILALAFLGFPTYFLIRFWDAVFAFLSSTFLNAMLEGDLIGFLFRGRQDYLGAIGNAAVESSYSYLFPLVGMGEYLMRKMSEAPLALQPGKGSTFEMDFFDLIGFYGLGSIVFIYFILKTLRSIQYDSRNNTSLFACFLVVLHSLLAGHVIFHLR